MLRTFPGIVVPACPHRIGELFGTPLPSSLLFEKSDSAQGVIDDRVVPPLPSPSGEESFHSAVLRGSVNVFDERIRR